MQIAVVLFERITALDAIGPYEVLQRIPGAEVVFAGVDRGPVRTDNGMLGLVPDAALDEVPSPDVVLVPGGIGTRALLKPNPVLEWVRSAHTASTWTTSVCTGSLVLAAGRVLDGLEATTHWGAVDLLGRLGAVPVDRRVVRAGKVLTAAGVSSGIDMGLILAAELAGEDVARAIRLMIEYAPQPPFDAGSVAKAGEATLALARTLT